MAAILSGYLAISVGITAWRGWRLMREQEALDLLPAEPASEDAAVMRIACISASQVPSMTANSMQVMKACQAISQLGHEVACSFRSRARRQSGLRLQAIMV